MKRIMFEDQPEVVSLKNVGKSELIFASQNDKLCGVVMHEIDGWIIRTGQNNMGATGYHKEREDCLLSAVKHGYEYFIN